MSANEQQSVQYGAQDDLSVTGHAARQLEANAAQRKALRANATTFESSTWEQMDEAVFGPVRERLVLGQAMAGAGLTFDVEPYQTEVGWKMYGDITDANVSMHLSVSGEEDKPEWTRASIPLPFIFKDYRFGYRELQKSERMGTGLDTTMASLAGRQVAEGVEDVILQGQPDLQTPGHESSLTLPGLLNVSGRHQITASGDWSTGTNASTDIKDAKNALLNDDHSAGGRGYWLLFGSDTYSDFDLDYDTDSDETTEEHVESMRDMSRLLHVPRMPNGEAVLIKPEQEVLDLARLADGPLNLEWEQGGGTSVHNRVYTVAAPRIKQPGAIAHITGV